MLLSEGLGFALCYTPAIAMVGTYFRQRKALAYGIAMSGSGIGTFVLAPVVQELMELYSWRGALLVLSAMVGNLCVCGALLRPLQLTENGGDEGESVEEERRGEELYGTKPGQLSFTELSVSTRLPAGITPSKGAELGVKLREDQRSCLSWSCPSSKEYRFLLLPDFLGLAVSFLFLASGCSLPFVYLVPYALSSGVSHQHAAFLMSILGIMDIVGNVTFGWLTDRRYRRVNVASSRSSSSRPQSFSSKSSAQQGAGLELWPSAAGL